MRGNESRGNKNDGTIKDENGRGKPKTVEHGHVIMNIKIKT